MLDWEAVKEMQSAGFGFESHGMSHRRLTEISPDDARGDIVRSKQILEDRLGRPVSFFAYPFMDFNPAVQTMVKAAGYLGACGGLPTWDGSLPDPYAIGRTEVLQSDGAFRFSVKTATGYGCRLYIKKRLGRWRRRAISIKSNRGNPD
jgi:peptidoglycan/xylan/chitin deacetylase (PgdA/CDA1 family)